MRFQDSKRETKQTVKSTIDDDEMHAHIGSVISSLPASDTCTITADHGSTGRGSYLRADQGLLL